MRPTEFAKLHREVKALMARELVCESANSCDTPILIVPKDGLLDICIDSKAMNKTTIKYHFKINEWMTCQIS